MPDGCSGSCGCRVSGGCISRRRARPGDARSCRRLLTVGLRVRIYECAAPDVPARARCLQRLVDDLVGVRASRLVLETLDSQLRADRATIGERLEKHGRQQPLVFEHRRAYEEPLLWAADALAWSYGAGGEWRRRIGPVLDAAIRLDP